MNRAVFVDWWRREAESAAAVCSLIEALSSIHELRVSIALSSIERHVRRLAAPPSEVSCDRIRLIGRDNNIIAEIFSVYPTRRMKLSLLLLMLPMPALKFYSASLILYRLL